MPTGGAGGRWDFFISYTQADRAWAEWIAWALEADGFRVLIQAWDFVPGRNWIQSVQAAVRDASHTIAVLSEAYLASTYASAEWQAAWASDPAGERRKLVPIRVSPCAWPGLLAGVGGTDLFGLTEAAAREKLREAISGTVTGRVKPLVPPKFPRSQAPAFPGPSTRLPPDDRGRPRTHGPSHPLRALTGHTAGVRCLAFSPDGSLLASAGSDQSVRLWDVRTWTAVRTLTGHAYAVTSVAFSPVDSLLASVGGDKTLRLWNVALGTLVRTLTGHTELVYGVAFSPDGSLIATAGGDSAVRIWPTRAGAPARNLTGHSSSVACVAFSPDGKLLASAGSDQVVRLWG